MAPLRLVVVALLAAALVGSAAPSADAAKAPPSAAAKHRAAVKKQAAAKRRAAAKRKAAAKHRAAARKRAAAKRKAAALAKARASVRSFPVTFTVKNTNTSKVSCAADGKTYEVKGHITGPAGRIADHEAAALYVHGLGYGEFFWHYQGVPGYDYATEQAKRSGLVSVTIDRLGYGASGHPDGNLVCYGSEADYLHQIVDQLRSGGYRLDGVKPARFDRIALVGHSAGGFMVEGTAISYSGVDALVIASFSNTGIGPNGLKDFGGAQTQCGTAPLPGKYARFGQTDADFVSSHFASADPAVVKDVLARRNPDPCQDTGSAPPAITADQANVPALRLPVLLVHGAQDAIFPPPAGEEERSLFSGADVSQVTLPDTGHAVTLGRTAPQFRSTVGDWLKGHGF